MLPKQTLAILCSMKRYIAVFLLLFLASALWAADQKKIDRLEKELKLLKSKAAKVTSQGDKELLNKRIIAAQKELDQQFAPPSKTNRAKMATPYSNLNNKPVPKIKIKQKPTGATESLPPIEYGLNAGLIASIPGIQAELRWNRFSHFKGVCLKTGLGYAQGDDSNKQTRKNFYLYSDLLYELTPPRSNGTGAYFGAGVNYLAYTTGRVSGTFGGQVYAGLQGFFLKHRVLYVEIGYGMLRTGFSPSFKGLTATVGVRNL